MGRPKTGDGRKSQLQLTDRIGKGRKLAVTISVNKRNKSILKNHSEEFAFLFRGIKKCLRKLGFSSP